MLLGDWGYRKKILSEAPATEEDPELSATNTEAAPEEDDGSANEYQLDDSDTADDEGDDPTTDDPSADDGGDGSDYTESPDGSDDGSGGDESLDGSDEGIDDSSEETDDGTTVKKMILLSQFREMNEIIDGLGEAVDKMSAEEEFETNEYFDYLQDKLIDLKSKLNFVLSQKFITSSYTELLNIFYNFKFNLNDLAKLAEKLVEKGNNKINN